MHCYRSLSHGGLILLCNFRDRSKAPKDLHTANAYDIALVKGANLVEQGEIEQGLAELGKATEADPSRWEAHFTRAKALQQRDANANEDGDGAAIVEALQKAEAALVATRAAKGHARASTLGSLLYVRNALGDALAKAARHEEACAAYELVMHGHGDGPGLPHALSKLGGCMHNVAGALHAAHAGDAEKVAACRGDAACAVAPEDVSGLAKRRKRLFRTRLAAVEALAEAVALDPKSAAYLKSYADYLFAAGRHEESVVQLRRHAVLQDELLA